MLKERGITIKEAMEMEPLKTSKLIAGSKGAGNIITRLNIMADCEIVDWVGEGELLLTTVLAMGSIVDQFEDLIKGLHKKGLAGLAIKTGSYAMGIDNRLIEAAERSGFPLIELDPKVPFSEITNTLSSHIFNKQAAIIVKLEKTHNYLTDIVLNGGGLKEIAKAIYNTIENPVVIKDCIFGGSEGEDGTESGQVLSKNLLPIVYREERLNNIFSKYAGETFESTDNINGRIVTRLNVPILASNQVYGYILLWELNKPIGTLDLRILETASPVIALEIVKRMSVYQVESRYKMEFLENLLSRDASMQNLAFERAHFFDLEETGGYTVMIVSVESSEPPKKEQEMTAKDLFNQYKNSIIQEIEMVLKLENEKFVIGEKSDSIIILLQAGEDADQLLAKTKSEKIGEKIVKIVDTKYYKTKISIGIGRHYRNPRELWKSYNEARKALNLGSFDMQKRVIHFESLGVYKILCNESLDSELTMFYKTTIYPLIEYDRRKRTDFIPTLQAYFETNGNLKKMADILYTHYNTILYRLQRIQQVAGIDLRSPSDRLNLEIGLKIMNIIEGKKS